MSRLVIRPVHSEDAARLAALATQLGYPGSESDLAARLAHLASAPLHAAWVVEVDQSEVVGFVHCFVDLRLETDPRCEIGGLVVDEAWRGRGLGRALVEEVEDWARHHGLPVLRLRSNVVRERAHALYRALGFVEVKRQVVMDKDIDGP
jgi:GNAT superfamily N-acetyltransferase